MTLLQVAPPPLQPKSPDTATAADPKQGPAPDTRVRVLCLPELATITKPDTNYQLGPPVKITVQPTLPRRRPNSPHADTVCADLAGTTTLPLALFVADEAGITVSSSTGWKTSVNALIGADRQGEFSNWIKMVCTGPDIGTIVSPHRVDLKDTVADAINACALGIAVDIGDIMRDEREVAGRQSHELVLLDHLGETVLETTC